LRWVPPPGVLGAATGAIAIGMAAMSTLTTKIILIAPIILTATSAAKAGTGSTTRNTVETRRTGIGKQRTSLVVRVRVERAELVVQVAQAELVDQVVSVGLADRVASVALAVRVASAELVVREAQAELVVREAQAELELVPVVVVPVRGHRHAQLAVPLRTRSVTGVHHPGLAPVLAAAASVAVAETTREPAAPEAVRVWAVAVTAVAAVGIAVAVAADAAAAE
jgi:hypothetical protein